MAIKLKKSKKAVSSLEKTEEKNRTSENGAARVLRFNPAFKITAFVLLVALSFAMTLKIIVSQDSQLWNWTPEDIGEKDFTQTSVYNNYSWQNREIIENFIYASAIEKHLLAYPEQPRYYGQFAQTEQDGTEQDSEMSEQGDPSEWDAMDDNEKQDLFNRNQQRIREELINQYVQGLTDSVVRNALEEDYIQEFNGRLESMFREAERELRQALTDSGTDESDITDEKLRELFELNYSGEIKAEIDYIFNENRQQIIDRMKNDWANKITQEMLWDALEAEYTGGVYSIPRGEYSQDGDSEGDSYRDSERGSGARDGDLKTVLDEPFPSEHWRNLLGNSYGVVYTVTIDGNTYTNTGLSVEEMARTYDCAVNNGNGDEPLLIHPNYDILPDGFSVNNTRYAYAFAFTDGFLAEKNAELKAVNSAATEMLIFSCIWLAAYLICAFYLVYSAGRKTAERTVTLRFPDGLFSEVTPALIFLAACGGLYWTAICYELFNSSILKYLYLGVIVLCFAVIYFLIASVVRNIKNRSLVKNALIYKFCKAVAGAVKKAAAKIEELYKKNNYRRKIYVTITVLGVLSMIPFLGFVTAPIALFLAYKQVSAFEEIIAAEAERRTKSERLKTELIVNVSHDIRTPLTSLITYADLLKNEDTDNENIVKYAEIISQKSDRLRVLTDDLFEAAKAASGNVTVNLANVEVKSLFTQALAEFDDRIKQSNLTFKMNLPDEKVVVLADGLLLWRVIENLMSNALKYSLENSRVYVDVREQGGNVFIEMKNISKTELNIPEDEITERFKRGDLSRNSEGSGLGLDIASSLMRCQHGELNVKIDGDLFKVFVRIPKAFEEYGE